MMALTPCRRAFRASAARLRSAADRPFLMMSILDPDFCTKRGEPPWHKGFAGIAALAGDEYLGECPGECLGKILNRRHTCGAPVFHFSDKTESKLRLPLTLPEPYGLLWTDPTGRRSQYEQTNHERNGNDTSSSERQGVGRCAAASIPPGPAKSRRS